MLLLLSGRAGSGLPFAYQECPVAPKIKQPLRLTQSKLAKILLRLSMPYKPSAVDLRVASKILVDTCGRAVLYTVTRQ